MITLKDLNSIKYDRPGYTLSFKDRFGLVKKCITGQIKKDVICLVTGKPIYISMNFEIPLNVDIKTASRIVLDTLICFEEHEVTEYLKIGDKYVVDPHPELKNGYTK